MEGSRKGDGVVKERAANGEAPGVRSRLCDLMSFVPPTCASLPAYALDFLLEFSLSSLLPQASFSLLDNARPFFFLSLSIFLFV
mmetsp:Transcript_29772/g.58438  ORF Transcript_29772/g.58438 Transcript_29772/m.58438 type:complete len:84 (+) Transcript_29772:182-433(+)